MTCLPGFSTSKSLKSMARYVVERCNSLNPQMPLNNARSQRTWPIREGQRGIFSSISVAPSRPTVIMTSPRVFVLKPASQ